MTKKWLFLFASNSLFALTTLHVSSSTDDEAGGTGSPGDLRYALYTMNTNLNTSIDDYAIVFDFPMTIQLNGILPIINNSTNSVNITIGNSGSTPTVTIDGNMGAYSGFFISTGDVTIQNMTFQNLTAKGGDGGDGISGGGGGMGAGGAIYAPQSFLDGPSPSITLMNVSINNCSAIGGNGGSYFSVSSPTGNEGGGGGGGFSGNGGSITTTGSTGGGGGGGFGGDGGNATVSTDTDPLLGGGGGGGGGFGSRTSAMSPTNLGSGGSDQDPGSDGNGYGLAANAGSGGGTLPGGTNGGGGGGGGAMGGASSSGGGGGGGSGGEDGRQPAGITPPGGSAVASGGMGTNGGGGGGGGVVIMAFSTEVDGRAGSGGYAGGGGGGAGGGASDPAYTVQGGSGGVGGGGGGGGVDLSGTTSADGGNSSGGGGGGGGGPSSGITAVGGTDVGMLGGGSGGAGASDVGPSFGGGGGGGGSGLGGAIFVDSDTTLSIRAFSGIPTTFNTTGNMVQAGAPGDGGPGSSPGSGGSALGASIFLRKDSILTFLANDVDDLLTLGEGVAFTDDTSFVTGGTNVSVIGKGTVIYNGSTNYQGTITINNANFKVNGTIEEASIFVCRSARLSAQRGTLSGSGTLTGSVWVNSGTISPDSGSPLHVGSLTLNSADPTADTLGSLVHIEIDSSGTSSVEVTGAATLAGALEIDLDASAATGTYNILSASSISGAFDSVTFTGTIPNYSLSYLPMFVQFDFLGYPSSNNPTLSIQGLSGNNLRVANYFNSLAPDANALGLTDQFALLNNLSFSQYQNALEAISPSRNSTSTFAVQNVMFMFSESLNSHFTKRRLADQHGKNRSAEETAFLTDNELVATNKSPRKTIHAPPQNTDSQIWAMGFGGFSSQSSQDQTPAFDFNNGGFVAAYDYGNTDEGCIGALIGYAHSSIQQRQSMGNSQINAGYLSLYGMSFVSDFFIDAAIWGEYMGVNQKRTVSFPGFDKTAKSSYHAGQFDLHFGTGYDFNMNAGTIEPFGLLDWVIEWDPSYTEKGAVPYNMKVSSRASWMLRFETGLNGYNTIAYSWGVFIAQGKLSYVYKKPHHVGHLNAAIVNAPGSFFVEAFTTSQSLVSPALELFWQTNWNGYGSISYDGEFGSGYTSNQFYGKIGYSF